MKKPPSGRWRQVSPDKPSPGRTPKAVMPVKLFPPTITRMRRDNIAVNIPSKLWSVGAQKRLMVRRVANPMGHGKSFSRLITA